MKTLTANSRAALETIIAAGAKGVCVPNLNSKLGRAIDALLARSLVVANLRDFGTYQVAFYVAL